MKKQEMLSIKFKSDDLNKEITIKDYLKELLLTLYKEKECFDAKRPFGNSSWEYELYGALIKHNVINGSFDEFGYIESVDIKKADKIIVGLIEELFSQKGDAYGKR